MKINKTTKGTGQAPARLADGCGATATRISKLKELKRSILACMLWEDIAYEGGESVAQRIEKLVPLVSPDKVAELAITARTEGKLRSVPLFLAREMARHATHKALVADVLATVIQRADELAEFLAIYWKDKKQPLAAQVKKGLARAFVKFDEHQLAKYNRENAIKLRDVLFLCHAKPQNKAQAAVWKRLINDELKTPDTWETALSASEGENKKEVWERLLSEEKLGALAVLRNLRNFKQTSVDEKLVRKALKKMNVDRVLPYRFITAAKYAPNLEPELEEAMFRAIDTKQKKIAGKTVLLLDVSGSMDEKISGKSESTRLDAASGLAVLARELFSDVEIYTFSNNSKHVPTRRGFALRDAIVNSQPHGGTYLGNSLQEVNAKVDYDRIIVFTDEQSYDRITPPKNGAKGYVINVSTEKHGIGYGAWNHIDGFSEAVLDFIIEDEKFDKD